MSLVATCPSCGTVFSMVREQLEASSGQVRCGHCMAVFDARVPANEALSADIFPPTTSFQTTSGELSHADLKFVQQAQKQAFWLRKSVLFTLGITALVLCLLLNFQIFHFQSERIVRAAPSLLPFVSAVCKLRTCSTPERLQIDGWQIESSSFRKEGDGAFRLALQLKNTLSVSLLVPQLEISFLDLTEALLVRRTIPLTETNESIPSGEDRTYSFLVSPQADLYNKITGYRLVLFYP